MLEIDHIEVVREHPLTLSYHVTIETGRLLIIRGPSGVGKTTLLDAIAGFVPVRTGQIRWHGQSLEHLPARKRPVTSMFQNNNLFSHLTVAENLKIALPHLSTKEHQQRLADIDLADQYHKPSSKLSGGQAQRVALLASVYRPEPVLLLDEPFSALDQGTSRQIQYWLKENIRQLKKTAVLVSHDDALTREIFAEQAEILELRS
ncbi:ATP-binding cassette domain-containing protein [Gynuella sunshinyii]|uniref:ABC-type spermidine/putrescine transport system, ATPase component n=1 Tax=Gynuella sunshinyii YC6258 TaxID=1445510 RepID=A0A0C5VGH3_9GAMM|nr:ATP-binding cassette domain-containing protein [Gynuella sunshinyii]AJQ93697.1 ABC-type spermidine/putrescine transport system, ATPase component [Gynuella sunshinyii YC6258]